MPIISVSGTLRIMRALLRIRAHSTWNTTWKVVDQIIHHLLLQKDCMSLLFCILVSAVWGICCSSIYWENICSICFPKKRASQHQTGVQVKPRDSKHALWSTLLSFDPYSARNKDPKSPKESNILRLWVFFHILLAVKPQANYLAFLCLCVLVCKTEW